MKTKPKTPEVFTAYSDEEAIQTIKALHPELTWMTRNMGYSIISLSLNPLNNDTSKDKRRVDYMLQSLSGNKRIYYLWQVTDKDGKISTYGKEVN